MNTIITIIWPPSTAAFYYHRQLQDWHHHHHLRHLHLVTHIHTSTTVKLAWNRGPIAPIILHWILAHLTRLIPLFQVMCIHCTKSRYYIFIIIYNNVIIYIIINDLHTSYYILITYML